MYTENIKATIDRFIINLHLYEDNSQLLAHMKINAVMEHHRRLETCVESLRNWCSSRWLQLNPDKTKLIWLGSRANLVTLRQLDVMSFNICSVAVEPVDSVWGPRCYSRQRIIEASRYKQNFVHLLFPSFEEASSIDRYSIRTTFRVDVHTVEGWLL